ncbi:uncharacterized protein BCR38DRAFT_408438 [Pseudomassariella vexata]|uniref:Uncharacterized protein n=1 Tax=Pseudomassariella vexata TaxID=1141098 RepID=A0A1Y2E4M8_9PEZI|nr:uncharacterized protein BCR38DRAFT_408438 [Pseudomassariella vexata]ORY66513.1 hypothetical protein BCR38DRAFT_408438 [Pseudomassariella vexata]
MPKALELVSSSYGCLIVQVRCFGEKGGQGEDELRDNGGDHVAAGEESCSAIHVTPADEYRTTSLTTLTSNQRILPGLLNVPETSCGAAVDGHDMVFVYYMRRRVGRVICQYSITFNIPNWTAIPAVKMSNWSSPGIRYVIDEHDKWHRSDTSASNIGGILQATFAKCVILPAKQTLYRRVPIIAG